MAVALLALCVALSGTAIAEPVARSAATVASTAKKALGLAKKADSRAKKANSRAKKALRLAEEPGPQGPKGDTGPQGPKGDTGAPGPTGSIQSAPAGGDLTGSYPDPLIAPNAVSGDQVEDSSLTGNDIGPSAIVPFHLANDSVGSSEIQGGAVGSSELGSNAVNSGNIVDGAVGAIDLGAITLRESAGVIVPGGTGGNGDYETREQEVICSGFAEVPIAGGGYWDAPSNTTELTITQLKLGTGSVSVRGGNDSGTDRIFKAQAYCLEL